jgi:hypothetical protein
VNVLDFPSRNVYMVFSYFWFFVGLPMGFFSAIYRILKAMVVGALMLPRIDHSVMPDGFQQIDQGNPMDINGINYCKSKTMCD